MNRYRNSTERVIGQIEKEAFVYGFLVKKVNGHWYHVNKKSVISNEEQHKYPFAHDKIEDFELISTIEKTLKAKF